MSSECGRDARSEVRCGPGRGRAAVRHRRVCRGRGSRRHRFSRLRAEPVGLVVAEAAVCLRSVLRAGPSLGSRLSVGMGHRSGRVIAISVAGGGHATPFSESQPGPMMRRECGAYRARVSTRSRAQSRQCGRREAKRGDGYRRSEGARRGSAGCQSAAFAVSGPNEHRRRSHRPVTRPLSGPTGSVRRGRLAEHRHPLHSQPSPQSIAELEGAGP